MMLDDTGAGNERTSLAWQRTALTVLATSGILTRLTFDRLGVVACACLLAAAPLGYWLCAEGRARCRRGAGFGRSAPPPDGSQAAMLAAATVTCAVVGLAAILLH